MARKRFHAINLPVAKTKVRATWSKYNLYNMSRFKLPPVAFQTYFQQKWAAKSASRAYHGEHIREGQWNRMFTTRLPSVVPMNARYLAEFDGSEQAAGRGSGKDRDPSEDKKAATKDLSVSRRPPVPYMHMTFAPLERRLDMAIWRALFASSARQARQMVIHGHVKVNGQKMPYPGYLLNPGDMFQVDTDSVLYATGDTKKSSQVREGRRLRRVRTKENIARAEKRAQFREKREAKKAEQDATAQEDLTVKDKAPRVQLSKSEEEQRKEIRKQYQLIVKEVKKYLAEKKDIGAKRKQSARAYLKDLKAFNSSISNKKADVKQVEKNFTALAAQLPVHTDSTIVPRQRDSKATAKSSKEAKSTGAVPEKSSEEAAIEDVQAKFDDLSFEEQKSVREAITLMRENPVDDSKPYATPWRPRPYMSPFAFIPRYLEVNQNVCSAVYLRHPVARPGLAEVPSPFGQETQQLAFNWYLKRR